MANQEDPEYTVGRTQAETDRLIQQAQLYESFSRLWLTNAGLRDGMRVVDVGCGAGDVAFLAASLVGPSGNVLAVDVNPDVIRTARERAHREGVPNVTFEVADFRELAPAEQFDELPIATSCSTKRTHSTRCRDWRNCCDVQDSKSEV